jgi:hypothetical protein
MNVALIIGVSEYSDPSNNLPGCAKDVHLMKEILSKSNKYDDILFLNEKMGSALLKERLTEFISSHKGKKIEELLFYYSGHGEFFSDEFYYLLSDFDEQKRKQTTLHNGEVDSLIKTLKPDLVVKIIDACQSGKSYIKEMNGLSKYFEKTQGQFNRCYFLNSSLNSQSSFQTDAISDFTKSFISSLKDHSSTEIRYKDIIDYISDEFEGNSTQTPFFVIQADYTEKFCSLSAQLRQYLDQLNFNIETKAQQRAESLSLIDKIKKQAIEYTGKEGAIGLVNHLREEIEKLVLRESLNDIFTLKVIFSEDYSQIVKRNMIGKWLDDNDHEFFARSKETRLRKDRYTNPFGSLRALQVVGTMNDEYEWVKDGFELDIEVPYKTIVFNLDSKFPNVMSFTCRIVYLLSKRTIAFFYFITNFEETNWDKRSLNSDIEWFQSNAPITKQDDVVSSLKKIFDTLQDRIEKYLNDTFDKKESEKSSD